MYTSMSSLCCYCVTLLTTSLNLVGLGKMRTHPLGVVILRVQVNEITSYDENLVFLVVPDKSEFSWHGPIVTGTCTLGRIVNVIKESEMDRLLTPWAMVRASCMLSQQGTVAADPGTARDDPAEEGLLQQNPGWVKTWISQSS